MEKMAIRLWDVATGEEITTFWGHPTDVQSLAFSPDNTLLASGSHDGTILAVGCGTLYRFLNIHSGYLPIASFLF